MIKVKNLTVKFDQKTVFQNLNFEVKQGQKLLITGSSGKGKTTLLNCLMGFVPNFKGEIYINNLKLTPENINKIRQLIAWLPQQVDVYFDTVEELFFAPFQLKANKKLTPNKTQIQQVFSQLGLEYELLTKKLNQISGGQKQRIAIASLWLLNKPIMLLDEPTSALDQQSKEKVISLLYSIPSRTILVVSHDDIWLSKTNHILNLDKF